MTDGLIAVTVNYYCPLQIHMTDEEYGDWVEVDNCYVQLQGVSVSGRPRGG